LSSNHEGPARAGSLLRLAGLVTGSLLFVAAVAAIALTEGGKGEFGYAPFTPEPLPFAAIRGFTLEQLLAHSARIFLATPALLLIWAAARHGETFRAPTERTLNRLAIGVSALSIGLVACFVLFVFRGRAIVDDELAYRMQAELLRDGHLGIQGMPYVVEVFTVKSLIGMTGKYLFGEPLVQVLGLLVGYPALPHVPIAAATLFALHRAVRRLGNPELGAWAVILVACSPMFILTSATAQSQATTLLCVVLAVLGYAYATTGGRAFTSALLVGIGIGFGATVRVQVAVPVGAVIVPLTLWAFWTRKSPVGLVTLLVTLGLFFGLIAAYDKLLTGSVAKLPWFLVDGPEQYGFGQVWAKDRYRHTPITLLENLGVVAVRFNAWWLGWPSSLVLLWLWFRNGKRTTGAKIWLWIGLAVLVFEAGYYSTGISDTGPIYHYELLLPAAVLGANALSEAFARNARSIGVFLTIQFGLGWTTFLALEGMRIDRLLDNIHADVEKALAQTKPPALLLAEPRCRESAAHGWIQDVLPVRYHSDRDEVVAFQRPSPRFLPALLKRYPGRACYYFRIDPEDHEAKVVPCAAALPLLLRPIIDETDKCLWIAPTATRLGIFDPFSAIDARRIKQKGQRTNSDAFEPAVRPKP
jgi:hypothetical protein